MPDIYAHPGRYTTPEAPRLPNTPPLLDDVNFVTVAEHEYVPEHADDPTHGSRLLAQVRRSWAVSRRRSTG